MKRIIIILLNLVFFLLAGYFLVDEFFRDRSVEWHNRAFLSNGDVFFLVVIVIGSFISLVRQFIDDPKSEFVTVVVGVFIDSLVILYSIFNVMASVVFMWTFIKNLNAGNTGNVGFTVLAFLILIGMGVLGVLTLQQIFKRERALNRR